MVAHQEGGERADAFIQQKINKLAFTSELLDSKRPPPCIYIGRSELIRVRMCPKLEIILVQCFWVVWRGEKYMPKSRQLAGGKKAGGKEADGKW